MPEYSVSFKKVIAGDEADVHARVSEDDPGLVRAVEQIRSRIVADSKAMRDTLDAVPNGHFMEIEFLVDGESAQGVVFLTPYLPEKFVALVRNVLADAGIENVV